MVPLAVGMNSEPLRPEGPTIYSAVLSRYDRAQECEAIWRPLLNIDPTHMRPEYPVIAVQHSQMMSDGSGIYGLVSTSDLPGIHMLESEVWQLGLKALKEDVPRKFTKGVPSGPYDTRYDLHVHKGHRVLQAQFSRSTQVPEAGGVLLKRVLEGMAKAIKCKIEQLVLCAVEQDLLFACPCDDLVSVTHMSKVVRQVNDDLPAPNMYTPFMLIAASAEPTFRIYPQMGEQTGLTTSAPGCKRRWFCPWPETSKQHAALTSSGPVRDRHPEGVRMQQTCRPLEHDHGQAELLICCFACQRIAAEGEERYRLCGGCRHIRYCSEKCQTQEWLTHKMFCKGYSGRAGKAKWAYAPKRGRQ